MTNAPSHDVFISYSTKDKPVADAICNALESRGVRAWIAPRDILPGQDYGTAIIEAINEVRVFVLVFSAEANHSPQVIREVERAVSKAVHIIPFRIESAAMSKGMEYYISSPHWLDAMTPPLERHVDKLVETVRRVLGLNDDEQSASRAPTTVAAPRPAKKAIRWWHTPMFAFVLVGIVPTVVLAIAGAVALWPLLRGQQGEDVGTRRDATGPTSQPTVLSEHPPTIVPVTPPAVLALPVRDGLVRKFEMAVGDEPQSAARVQLAPDASRVVVGPDNVDARHADFTATSWDVASGRPLMRVPRVYGFAPSHDGTRAFVASAGQGIAARDTATGQSLCEFEVDGRAAIAEWSPDAARLAIGNGETVAVYDARTGARQRQLGGTGIAWQMTFTPDGSSLITSYENRDEVVCHDPTSGVLRWRHAVETTFAVVQLATDGRRVRVSRDSTAVLDARDGHKLIDVEADVNESVSEMSPDGAWLVAVGRKEHWPIRLWAVDNGTQVERFTPIDAGDRRVVKFTPRGDRLLIGTKAGHVVVLDFNTGRQIADFTGGKQVDDLSLSADGRFAASSSGEDGVTWLWRLPD